MTRNITILAFAISLISSPSLAQNADYFHSDHFSPGHKSVDV